jgi:hypothetical protein
MKMTVVTNEKGHVVATYRHLDEKESQKGQPRLRLYAGPKQSVNEIDLPSELEKITSAEELHTRLREHLKKKSK